MANSVILTERAARRIGEILKSEPAGAMLRVSVEGGGCSGFQYKFDFDQARTDDDLVLICRLDIYASQLRNVLTVPTPNTP